jgi:ABC-type polar amino acid transport system ATPase subunit
MATHDLEFAEVAGARLVLIEDGHATEASA